MSKRKYKAGYCFMTMSGFSAYGGTYFMVDFGNGKLKTLHRGFVESWQYRVLKQFVEQGRVYTVERIEEENA
jgi:hypothetical protein